MKLKSPVFLIDKTKVENNIDRMMAKAGASSVTLRPHFKTHQSLEVGHLFRKKGVDKITVSSVSMARYFARDGWHDITIAFPLNLPEVEDINTLASKIHLNVLVESQAVAQQLKEKVKAPMGVLIKIDTGYHRTGLPVTATDEIDAIMDTLDASPLLMFRGFLVHAGHSYHAKSRADIIEIKAVAEDHLSALRQKYIARYPDLVVSYGDTPSCSQAEDCSGFDEIRPGNFVYYDVMQYHLGSCAMQDIAVAVACPVVALHPDRNEMVVYGGGVHLSKEFIAGDNGFQLFGYIVRLHEDGSWGDPIPGAYVSSLSQEHGIIKLPSQEMKKCNAGDFVGILPIHSCMTANLMREHTELI